MYFASLGAEMIDMSSLILGDFFSSMGDKENLTVDATPPYLLHYHTWLAINKLCMCFSKYMLLITRVFIKDGLIFVNIWDNNFIKRRIFRDICYKENASTALLPISLS
jgi:hypothetical protein